MDELKDLGFLPLPKGFGTTTNHAGQDPDNWDSLCVMPPIVLSSTFKHLSSTKFKKYDYSRSGNPTRDCLETLLASTENAKYGLCFSSGLAAVTGLATIFKNGDHLIVSEQLYGGTNQLFKYMESNFGIEVSFMDCSSSRRVEAAIKSNTKLIYLETPVNPTLDVIDIRDMGQVAKKYGILFGVDNTFLTAYLQRPLELGADFSLYSVTKYLNGHTDVVMGAIVMNNEKLYEKLKFVQNSLGIIPSPFDCYQVIRGMKTLHVRLNRQSSNSYKLAKFLEGHPKIEKVLHPCLPSHPSYEITKKQTSGHSGLFAFYLKGDQAACDRLFSALKLFTLAASLGGTESLIVYPSTMTHSEYSKNEQLHLNITENLIRISVGLEDTEDLVEDLRQALEKC